MRLPIRHLLAAGLFFACSAAACGPRFPNLEAFCTTACKCEGCKVETCVSDLEKGPEIPGITDDCWDEYYHCGATKGTCEKNADPIAYFAADECFQLKCLGAAKPPS
jgi:hypothetical protein